MTLIYILNREFKFCGNIVIEVILNVLHYNNFMLKKELKIQGYQIADNPPTWCLFIVYGYKLIKNYKKNKGYQEKCSNI